jgi:hypothetical protein
VYQDKVKLFGIKSTEIVVSRGGQASPVLESESVRALAVGNELTDGIRVFWKTSIGARERLDPVRRPVASETGLTSGSTMNGREGCVRG